jgi:hypothetical protein
VDRIEEQTLFLREAEKKPSCLGFDLPTTPHVALRPRLRLCLKAALLNQLSTTRNSGGFHPDEFLYERKL